MGETSVLSIQHIGEMEMEAQRAFCEENKRLLLARYGRPPKALVRAFGCAQNMDDGEKIKGMLAEMGCQFTDSVEEADIALYNTCAIRENAEQKVFGILGQATHQKESRREMLIALCGCMAQQKEVSDKLKQSFPGVDLVFGPHALYKLPQLLHETILHAVPGHRRRVYDTEEIDGVIAEGIPTLREDKVRAGLPIMYGCNNFCTYCVVPLVRGRERSRRPEDILREAKELIAAGYKEITLLGQNVNSYGKNGEEGMDFPELLEAVANLPGDFWVRFMTSHPRDCTHKLIDTMARNPKICKSLHLPVQSGSTRVLQAMNRHYTREQYLEIVRYAKEKSPASTSPATSSSASPARRGRSLKRPSRLSGKWATSPSSPLSSPYTYIYWPPGWTTPSRPPKNPDGSRSFSPSRRNAGCGFTTGWRDRQLKSSAKDTARRRASSPANRSRRASPS